MAKTAILEDRGFIRVSGADALPFLQGIVTNDVGRAEQGSAIYACLLTPQGQYLHDFFITRDADAFLLECAAASCADIIKRLTFYKLRSKVEIEDWQGRLFVHACFGGDGKGFPDPRHIGLGRRIYAVEKIPANASRQDYVDFCIDLGIPDSRAMRQGRDFLSALNLDQLNAVAWDKGCFVGQELTARIEYRGLAKKRLAIVTGSGLAEGEKLLEGEGQEAGEIRLVNASQNKGLAVLKLAALNGPLTAGTGGVAVQAALPGWLRVSGT